MKNIPHSRLVVYALICGLLPAFFSYFYFSTKFAELDALKMNIQQVNTAAFVREKRQATNMAVQSAYRDADHFYIDKEIETIPLLESEIEGLKKVVDNPNFTEDETIKKRLEFLTGTGNRLVFSEGIVQSTPLFQEVTETLVHPIEINTNDLKHILSKIEGKDIGSHAPGKGRPQLIILDFKIEKKNVLDKNEVYQLNLKLLKREYL